jgi:hypothetical protein
MRGHGGSRSSTLDHASDRSFAKEIWNMTRQRNIHSLLMAGCACLGLICTSSSTFAQQTREQAEQQNATEQTEQNERSQRQGRQAQAELPQFLQELDLNDEQETQIRQALQQHNQKLRRAWRQFHTTHAEAVNLEAAWTAAVRDSLSEEDQRRFDQQRMQDQETSQRSGRDANQRRDRASQRQDEADNRGNRRQNERDDASEQRAENREQRQAANQRRGQETARAGDRADDSGDREAVGLIIVTTSSPERFLEGTNQTAQQKQQCDKACRDYQQKLTSVWSELHQLHHELVKIEAERIQAIEEQLTEDQLAKLKEDRQQPQDSQASEASSSRRSQ